MSNVYGVDDSQREWQQTVCAAACVLVATILAALYVMATMLVSPRAPACDASMMHHAGAVLVRVETWEQVTRWLDGKEDPMEELE